MGSFFTGSIHLSGLFWAHYQFLSLASLLMSSCYNCAAFPPLSLQDCKALPCNWGPAGDGSPCHAVGVLLGMEALAMQFGVQLGMSLPLAESAKI